VDVFSIAADEKEAYVNYLKVVNGAIIHTHTQELVKNLDEEEEDILTYTIDHLRERFNSIATEIILPYEIPLTDSSLQITVPKIGDKKKLLELSEKNVKYYLLQKKKQEATYVKKQTPTERILRTMQKDLQMDVLPIHLECFDNSNIQGSNPVSSCVVFKNAKPSKKDYRHYNIKTVEGPNDFASMEEVVYRRYKRLVNEGEPLPQLIIIDGGKGQLSAAVKILDDLGIRDKMTVIGIAKRLEEIFFPNDPIPLYIDKKSESLKVIQQARNEAHRFAINFHRDQRSRNFLGTELTQIPGVGEKTAQKLLAHFGSVKKIKDATVTDLAEVVSMSAAKKVKGYLENP
jgi:excinuclease ABC subunit C